MSNAQQLGVKRWGTWPSIVFVLVFFVMPLAAMIVVSFWVSAYGRLTPAFSLSNYVKFFGTPYLRDSLINSLEVTLLATTLSVVLAYPLAYLIAYWVPPRWQRIVLLLYVLPFWTAYVVRSYSWLLILSDNGILNVALERTGLIDEPLKFAYNRGATVLGFVHFCTMLLTLTIYANLVQINPSYLRAAQDLGASRLNAFLRVTLPLSVPGVAVGFFLSFVIVIGDYITPQVLGGNTEVLVPQAIMLQALRAANIPMATVMSLSLMMIVIVVYLMIGKHLKMDRV